MEVSYVILSLLSYIALFLKDIIIADIYGVNAETDAFFFSYQVVFVFLVILGGIGGPFYKTTVLIASGLAERPKPEVQKLLNSFLTVSGLSFLVFSIIIFIFSDVIAEFLINRPDSISFAASVSTQLRILSPVLFIGGVTGILSGIFNTYGKFHPTASGSAITGLVCIIIVLLFGKSDSSEVLGFAFLLGVAAQFLYQVVSFLLFKFEFKPEFDFKHPRFIIIRKLFIPVFLTLLIGNLYILVDMYFAAGLSNRLVFASEYKGGWSELYYATSIFFFVSGVILSVLGTLSFKEFDNTTREIYLRTLSNYYSKILDFVFFLAIPVSVFIIVFSRDIVQFIYQRGNFSEQATVEVANILAILAIAILPFLMKSVVFKTFYSINKLNLPLFVAISALLLKAGINFLLVKIFNLGINGIAISTVIVLSIEAILLAFLIKKKIKADYEGLIYVTVQIIPVTLLTMLVIAFEKAYGVNLIICSVSGLIVYFIFSLPIKIYAAEVLFNNIKTFKIFSVFAEMKNQKPATDSQLKDYEYLYKELVQEKEKSEQLLSNILPDQVAEELKETGSVKPVHYENVSVMFTDFQGFTKISKVLTEEQLIKELDSYYRLFDIICEKYNLEKIKTIGDSYMCVGGLPVQNKTHAIDCVLAAFCFLIYIHKVKLAKKEQNLPYFNIRIGIHSGSVVAGVIGTNKSSYDVWGDTVNLASRMESSGEPGIINISEATYELVKDFFECSSRGEKEVKNAGKMSMYFVKGIKPEFADPANKLIPHKDFYKKIEPLLLKK